LEQYVGIVKSANVNLN